MKLPFELCEMILEQLIVDQITREETLMSVKHAAKDTLDINAKNTKLIQLFKLLKPNKPTVILEKLYYLHRSYIPSALIQVERSELLFLISIRSKSRFTRLPDCIIPYENTLMINVAERMLAHRKVIENDYVKAMVK